MNPLCQQADVTHMLKHRQSKQPKIWKTQKYYNQFTDHTIENFF